MLSKRYESSEVDSRTLLHVPSGTHWYTISDTHQVVEILKENVYTILIGLKCSKEGDLWRFILPKREILREAIPRHFFRLAAFKFLLNFFKVTYSLILCRMRRIAANRDHFVRRRSVRWSHVFGRHDFL